jgi:nicotinate-nucleotide adenylyltransferase
MQKMHGKIGLLGGTFDPIHFGHLIIGEEIRDNFGLDRILFIPSGHPPHKEGNQVTGASERFEMVKLATMGNDFFEVSHVELDRPGKTFTIDTIRFLKSILTHASELYFIIGADVLPELVLWKDYKELFHECRFITVMRPTNSREDFNHYINLYKNDFSARIDIVEASLIEISSTAIRNRVKNNRSIKYLVPENVENYIMEHNLYR